MVSDLPNEQTKASDTKTITWLHLSDLHQRRPGVQKNQTHLYNSSEVVLDKLLKDIRELVCDDGLRPDFIVFWRSLHSTRQVVAESHIAFR